MEKRELSYTVGGNANWYSHNGKQCGDSLKKLEIELPYDPAIPLLGILTEETRIERDTCTPVFIAALFIKASTWKQPRCISADEWIRKSWYIYTIHMVHIHNPVPSLHGNTHGTYSQPLKRINLNQF